MMGHILYALRSSSYAGGFTDIFGGKFEFRSQLSYYNCTGSLKIGEIMMGHILYAPRSSSYAGGFTDMQAKHAFLRKQTSFAPQRACFIALFVDRRKFQNLKEGWQQELVTDRIGVLLFCPNQTEEVNSNSVCQTAPNRTKHIKNI